MGPIVKWKDGKYSRILLPHEINIDTMFGRRYDLMYGLNATSSTTTEMCLTGYDDIYNFLDQHPEYLFTPSHIGKTLWGDVGVSYLIDDTDYVVNIPCVPFPQIDNYVHMKLGPLPGIEIIYTKAFFTNRQVVPIEQIREILNLPHIPQNYSVKPLFF